MHFANQLNSPSAMKQNRDAMPPQLLNGHTSQSQYSTSLSEQ